MDSIIQNLFADSPALLEFGRIYTKSVYDDCINEFYSALITNNKRQTFITKLIKELSNESQVSALKILVKKVIYSVSSLFLHYFDQHKELYIFIGIGEKRISLSHTCNSLTDSIMGVDGVLHYTSNYYEKDKPLDLIRLYNTSAISAPVQIDLPSYYTNRPELTHFAETFIAEVYDAAIQQWFEIVEGNSHNDNNFWPNELISTSSQLSIIKQIIQFWIYDFILKATGIFESADFWLIQYRDEKEIHISYTDSNNQDFERNELSFDMHDTESDGIINLFSKYGIPQ